MYIARRYWHHDSHNEEISGRQTKRTATNVTLVGANSKTYAKIILIR